MNNPIRLANAINAVLQKQAYTYHNPELARQQGELSGDVAKEIAKTEAITGESYDGPMEQAGRKVDEAVETGKKKGGELLQKVKDTSDSIEQQYLRPAVAFARENAPGAAIGAGTGALAGALMGKDRKSRLKAAIIGALAGAPLGMAAQYGYGKLTEKGQQKEASLDPNTGLTVDETNTIKRSAIDGTLKGALKAGGAGALAGGALGAGIGAVAGESKKAALKGLLIGALTGGFAGAGVGALGGGALGAFRGSTNVHNKRRAAAMRPTMRR